MVTSVRWLKRDFRPRDNPALTAALVEGGAILPMFLFEPSLLGAEEAGALHVGAFERRKAVHLNTARSHEKIGSRRLAHSRTWRPNAPRRAKG